MRKRYRTTFRYRFLRFLCWVLGVVFLVMLSGTLLFRHLMDQMQIQPQSDVRILTQEQLDVFLGIHPQNLTADDTPKTVSFPEHNTRIGGMGSGIVNILLIGQDRREGDPRSRSDSMILCTIQKETGKLTLTSFLRDLYVQIPGYRSNRINAAYAAGGMPLLRETFRENFGIQVDGCIEVDFLQFSRLIDLVGGVEVELRQDEAETININCPGSLQSGRQRLSGEQALAYARIRNLDADSDFSRTNRQRKILSALLSSAQDLSFPDALTLMGELIPMISTDIKEARLLLYCAELLPVLPRITLASQRIPGDGCYTTDTIDGMSVLVADMEATRKLLRETLCGE